MKIGLMTALTDSPEACFDDIVIDAQRAEAEGFSAIWMANIFGLDAISTLSIIGPATKTIELGTAVTPTYPRHPTALAQQALTAAVASGNRFNLGIGLSHKVVIENMFGFSYDKPAQHMREYLSVLMPLLAGETVQFKGDHYNVNGVRLTMAGQPVVPTLIAALGPVMLNLAGAMADGTITWMTGAKTLETHIIPKINDSAEKAGRKTPRVVAGFPILLTDQVAETRARIDQSLAIYGTLPSYRAMLDKEGLKGPGDLAIVGDETEVRARLDDLRAIGVTDFTAAIAADNAEDAARTRAFLASEC